tara:strand:- start:2419 stop:3009 length:591 start_codon:yes stop_codon:yes gene_type:complete
MGYHTEFYGSFELDEPLTGNQVNYLKEFARTRRMKRDVEEYINGDRVWSAGVHNLYESVGLPIGEEGAYVADGAGWELGEHMNLCLMEIEVESYDGSTFKTDSYNNAPIGQPGLWCKWVPTDNGKEIEWNGHEKFYDYTEWIEYIIEHFLTPWGRTLNGQVRFYGEGIDDRGVIYIKDNKVERVYDEISNRGPSWD